MSDAKELANKMYELMEKVKESLSDEELEEYESELDRLMGGAGSEDEEEPDMGYDEGSEPEEFAEPEEGMEDEGAEGADPNSALAAMFGGGGAPMPGRKPPMPGRGAPMPGSEKEDLKRRIKGYFG